MEVTQSEVAVTAAQTRLAEMQYDYKIAEVTLAYTSQGDDTGRILLFEPLHRSRRSDCDPRSYGSPHETPN